MQNDLTPADFGWPSQFVRSGESTLRVLVQGAGPAIVIVASYGRDGGADFDDIANALVKAGYLVLRPQPRGVFGSTGPMHHVTLDDFVKDVAEVTETLGGGKAIVIGHAFGALVRRMLRLGTRTRYQPSSSPRRVRRVSLRRSQISPSLLVILLCRQPNALLRSSLPSSLQIMMRKSGSMAGILRR